MINFLLQTKDEINALAGLTSALTSNGSVGDIATSVGGSKNAVENNFLGPDSRDRELALLSKGLNDSLSLKEKKEFILLEKMDQIGDEYLSKYRQDPKSLSAEEAQVLNGLLNKYYYEMEKHHGAETAKQLVNSLIADGASFKQYGFPYAATSELKKKVMAFHREGMSWFEVLTYQRELSPEEKLYHQSISDIGAQNYHEFWGKIGEPALNFLPGGIGLAVNIADAAIGGSQIGKGVGQIVDNGVSGEAIGNIAEGILTVGTSTGGLTLKGKGKPDGSILSVENPNIWQETTIGNSLAKGDGALVGYPTQIDANMSKENIRSLNRENESAKILSQSGFHVEQNPKITGIKNPDYRINGEIFDNYVPSFSNARNIWSGIKEKIDSGQTTNVVMNLSDTKVSIPVLQKQLSKWPIIGLEKVIIIDKSGNVVRVK